MMLHTNYDMAMMLYTCRKYLYQNIIQALETLLMSSDNILELNIEI